MPIKRKNADGLTPVERKFVAEYLVDMNPTAALLRLGWTARTAAQNAQYFLRRPAVREAIARALRRIEAHSVVSAARALEETARIAFSDPRNAIGEDGMVRALADMDEDTARAVASVKIVVRPGKDGGEPTITQELKFWDKNAAIEKILKATGRSGEEPTVNVNMGVVPVLEEEQLSALENRLREVLGMEAAKTRPRPARAQTQAEDDEGDVIEAPAPPDAWPGEQKKTRAARKKPPAVRQKPATRSSKK